MKGSTNEARLARLARTVGQLADGWRFLYASSYLLASAEPEALAALRALAPRLQTGADSAEREFWLGIDSWCDRPPLERCLAHVRASGGIEALALLTLRADDVGQVVRCLLELIDRRESDTVEASRRPAGADPLFGLQVLAALWALDDAEQATIEEFLPRIEPSRWIERQAHDVLQQRLHDPNAVRLEQLGPSWARALHPAIAREPLGGALRRATLAADPLDVLSGELMAHCPGKWVIYGDLDHLKTLNDTYGFVAGDLAIRGTIETLQEAIGDHVVRIGGEELLIFHDGPDGPELAESLRLRVEQAAHAPVGHLEQPVRVTISFGVATAGETGPCLRRAEQALDEAKLGGRNRVVVAG